MLCNLVARNGSHSKLYSTGYGFVFTHFVCPPPSKFHQHALTRAHNTEIAVLNRSIHQNFALKHGLCTAYPQLRPFCLMFVLEYHNSILNINQHGPIPIQIPIHSTFYLHMRIRLQNLQVSGHKRPLNFVP